jgi:hypothetical protein
MEIKKKIKIYKIQDIFFYNMKFFMRDLKKINPK